MLFNFRGIRQLALKVVFLCLCSTDKAIFLELCVFAPKSCVNLSPILSTLNRTIDIALIGAGNLATSLAHGLVEAGFGLRQVVARSEASAQRLAQPLGVLYTAGLHRLTLDADVYIIAVPDAQIADVLEQMPPTQVLMLHTSGSTPMSVFNAERFPNHGVLYPLQTFSRQRVVSLRDVPLCIEASTAKAIAQIQELANALSSRVIPMTSEQRVWLHLMGVMGCNFVNHLLAIAHCIGQKEGIALDVLQPLLCETVRKAFSTSSPAMAQTGPAIRGDMATLSRHADMLANIDVHFAELYNMLSNSIINTNERLKS